MSYTSEKLEEQIAFVSLVRPTVCPSVHLSLFSCEHDISLTVWARALKLGELIMAWEWTT